MNNKEKEKEYSSQKWLYYQDVKVLNKKVKLTEKEKKKVEAFNKFIEEKEKDTKKDN